MGAYPLCYGTIFPLTAWSIPLSILLFTNTFISELVFLYIIYCHSIITACLICVLYWRQFIHNLLSCLPLGSLVFNCQCLQGLLVACLFRALLQIQFLKFLITTWLLGALFQIQCLHYFIADCIRGFLFQRKLLHIHLNDCLLGFLFIFTCHWLHNIVAPLLSIIFVWQQHHCLTDLLVYSHISWC